MRSPKAVGFVVLTAVMLLYTGVHRGEQLWWDSSQYWDLGETLFDPETGVWSLKGYTKTLRPVMFPLLLSLVQGLARAVGASELGLFRVLSSINFGLLCGVLAPALVERLWGERLGVRLRGVGGVVRILLFGGCVFLFWRGHFLYPLTDFPAVTFWGFAVYCVLPRTAGARQAWWWFVLAGASLALAYLCRPAYQAGVILPLFVIARRMVLGSGRGWRTPARVGLMVVGMLLVSLPQMAVNKRLSDSLSPFASGQGLFMTQLRWGLLLNRYETNVGDAWAFPNVGFADREGVEIFRRQGYIRSDQIKEYGQYFRIVLEEPVGMASLYMRRVFSGMDVWFPSTYVNGPIVRNPWLGLATYTLWFVAGCVVWRGLWRWGGGGGSLWGDRAGWFDRLGALVVFCAPVGLAVPTAVEPRFFLPAHLVVYGAVCFGAPWVGLRAACGRRALGLWLGFILFVLCCNMVSSWMFSGLLPMGGHQFLSDPLTTLGLEPLPAGE